MTLLHVVVAWTQTSEPPQIQLCGAYLTHSEAEAHAIEASTLNPHLIFMVRICPFPEKD